MNASTSFRTTSGSRRSSSSSTSRSATAPADVLIMPDGKTAFVANRSDDSLSVIDLERLEATARIDLGGPKEITKARYGERLFHSANITFHRQFSCHTCHPDGHVDGITYDIEPDGIGVNPVDNRTLRGILDTAPFKWEGTNPSLSPAVRAAAGRLLHAHPAVQSGGALRRRPLHLDDPAAAQPLPSPGGRLYASPAPGKACLRAQLDERRAADPREPPLRYLPLRPPYYTDRSIHDVGTQQEFDQRDWFRRAPPEQHLRFRSVPAQRHRADARGDLDALQSQRHARGHERHDQGPAQRPDRVSEDVCRRSIDEVASDNSLSLPGVLAFVASASVRGGLALRLHELEAVHGRRTACRTTTSSPSRSMARGSGSAPRTAWP